MNSKGVSETFGAMLVIAVMISAAGIIYMISYPTIIGGVENIAYRNAIKSMAEIKELAGRMKHGGEERTTKTIQLGGGSIYTARGMDLKLNGDQYSTRDLVIRVAGKEVVFQTGIFEKHEGKVIPFVISHPDITATKDTMYFSFYSLTGNFSAAGSRTTLNLEYLKTEKRTGISSLEIKSEFCELWKKAIEEALSRVSLTADVSDCTDGWLTIQNTNISIFITEIMVR